MTSKRGKSDFLELVKSDRPKSGKLPRVLQRVEQALAISCERLLRGAFLASDDAVYELSSRANSNSEENLYFESMRQIRLGQQGITKQFIQNLNTHFSLLLDGRTVRVSSEAEPFTAQTLSILGGDELEIDLAFKNMVSRARDLYREPLYELNARLGHLLAADVQEANNPLDPQQITRSFVDACADALTIDIKVRLILFKLFEKHVLKQLAPTYAEANQLFIDEGILPKVSRQLSKSEDALPPQQQKAADQQKAPEQPQPAQKPELGPNAPPETPRFNVSLETLVSLMSAARDSGRAGFSQTPVVNCYIFASDNPGPMMSSPQLSALLTRTQMVADRQLARAPRNIVPEVVNNLLRRSNAESPQALAETDETIINLVSLFFEQILADDNLPMAVYALICRLQIPILKIALQDSSFFSRPDHPARELINTITETGIGFDESRPLERDPVYRKAADIVQTISRQPKIDETTFFDLHQELKAAIRAEQLKISIVEKRTSQSAVGRSRIRAAKRNAQNLLYSKLHGVPLPLAVSEFLTTAWLQVLIITQLKHGHESEEWFANADTVIDLVWLCQRHQDVRSLQRREEMQYSLMQRIEAGLGAAIESPEVREGKIHKLQQALHDINTGSAELVYGVLTPEQRVALGQVDGPEAAYREATEPKPTNRVSPTFLEKARDLSEGTWVEYADENTGQKWRYKLVAKADPEAYVFVNRLGFKTLERSCRQLAYDMQTNKMKPLTCTEFFDRMMNKVLSRLGKAA